MRARRAAVPRRVVCLAVALLVLAGVGVVAGPAADPVGAVPAVEIVGHACAPNTGVTVVVDFTALADLVEVGCALGAQDDGFAALQGFRPRWHIEDEGYWEFKEGWGSEEQRWGRTPRQRAAGRR